MNDLRLLLALKQALFTWAPQIDLRGKGFPWNPVQRYLHVLICTSQGVGSTVILDSPPVCELSPAHPTPPLQRNSFNTLQKGVMEQGL